MNLGFYNGGASLPLSPLHYSCAANRTQIVWHWTMCLINVKPCGAVAVLRWLHPAHTHRHTDKYISYSVINLKWATCLSRNLSSTSKSSCQNFCVHSILNVTIVVASLLHTTQYGVGQLLTRPDSTLTHDSLWLMIPCEIEQFSSCGPERTASRLPPCPNGLESWAR